MGKAASWINRDLVSKRDDVWITLQIGPTEIEWGKTDSKSLSRAADEGFVRFSVEGAAVTVR